MQWKRCSVVLVGWCWFPLRSAGWAPSRGHLSAIFRYYHTSCRELNAVQGCFQEQNFEFHLSGFQVACPSNHFVGIDLRQLPCGEIKTTACFHVEIIQTVRRRYRTSVPPSRRWNNKKRKKIRRSHETNICFFIQTPHGICYNSIFYVLKPGRNCRSCPRCWMWASTPLIYIQFHNYISVRGFLPFAL